MGTTQPRRLLLTAGVISGLTFDGSYRRADRSQNRYSWLSILSVSDELDGIGEARSTNEWSPTPRSHFYG